VKFLDLAINPAVVCALRYGYEPALLNKSARRHFDWFIPGTNHRLSIHHFAPRAKRELSYTVDRQSTSSVAQAIAWLKETGEPLPAREAGLRP
jgi:hypothetical protein